MASEQNRNGEEYWKVVYAIEFKLDGWNPFRILNEGPIHWEVGAGGVKIKKLFSDEEGVKTGRVGLLTNPENHQGVVLPSSWDPIFIEFDIYKSETFAELNLFPGIGRRRTH